MTITDVAGLEALPVGSVVRDAEATVWERADTFWIRTGVIRDRPTYAIILPLEVLSPRIVTPEQVETGARAMFEHLGMTWEVAVDDEKRDSREVVLAALAAMGIGVSDG